MEFLEKTAEELEARKAEIRAEIDTEGADLDALEAEARAINAELEERQKKMEKKAEIIEEVLEERSAVIEVQEEPKKMTDREIRSSKEYIDAYVDYLKGKNDGSECRAMLTENGSGTVPVPEYVAARIEATWENDQILSRVKKTFLRGNVKVGVEMAADPAVVHTEGGDAPDEENLTLAIVNIVAQTIKKWISVTTEVMDMNGEAFLDYIYDEVEYQIVKKFAEIIVGKIAAAPTSGTSAPIVSSQAISSLALGDIVTAMGDLAGSTSDLVFIANNATIAAYRALALGANYGVDIFMGCTPIATDALDSFNDASDDEVFAIVGDLKAIQANFPNGDEVKFVFDPYSLAEADLVKVVGRMYAGAELIRNKAFTLLAKEAE